MSASNDSAACAKNCRIMAIIGAVLLWLILWLGADWSFLGALVLAAILGAGLWGIEQRIEPTAPCQQNAYDAPDDLPEACCLPQNFITAIDRFRASKIAEQLFGAKFVQVFADTRAAQEREFREKVSEHELRRFLELA